MNIRKIKKKPCIEIKADFDLNIAVTLFFKDQRKKRKVEEKNVDARSNSI